MIYHKYNIEPPEGKRLEKIKCPKCYGVKFYSGKYGYTACEECSNGFVFVEVEIYKKKKK